MSGFFQFGRILIPRNNSGMWNRRSIWSIHFLNWEKKRGFLYRAWCKAVKIYALFTIDEIYREHLLHNWVAQENYISGLFDQPTIF